MPFVLRTRHRQTALLFDGNVRHLRSRQRVRCPASADTEVIYAHGL
jgi:hypothetical protein